MKFQDVKETFPNTFTPHVSFSGMQVYPPPETRIGSPIDEQRKRRESALEKDFISLVERFQLILMDNHNQSSKLGGNPF